MENNLNGLQIIQDPNKEWRFHPIRLSGRRDFPRRYVKIEKKDYDVKQQGLAVPIEGRGDVYMRDIAPAIISIADASLGGLQGRSALLIGPKEQRTLYTQLLRREMMKDIYEEDTPERVVYLLPYVQLLINTPEHDTTRNPKPEVSHMLTAAQIARGCTGRTRPLVIFDLAQHTSVEELAGLLPPVCLYTPEDIRNMLHKSEAKAS